jgi:uncharacterized protein (DUF433 family)
VHDVSEPGERTIAKTWKTDPEVDRYIERREGVVGGEPVIVDTRISVRDIVLYWRVYGDINQIISALRIPAAGIRAALRYYELNPDEIDQYIREDEEAGEAIERENREAG